MRIVDDAVTLRPVKRSWVAVFVSAVVMTACSGSATGGPSTADDAPAPTKVDSEESVLDDGGDGVGVGSAGDFCDAVSALMEAEFDDDEAFGPEARALLEDVRATAPTGLVDDVTVVLDVLDDVQQIESEAPDPDDEETFDRVLELIFSPDFEAASRSIEAYGVSECGFEPVATDDG